MVATRQTRRHHKIDADGTVEEDRAEISPVNREDNSLVAQIMRLVVSALALDADFALLLDGQPAYRAICPRCGVEAILEPTCATSFQFGSLFS